MKAFVGRLSACIVASAGVLLTACAGLGAPPKPTAFYDLGLVDPVSLPASVIPAQVEVSAPSWLDASTMQYRLAWNPAQRRRSYSESRWVAQPSEMLASAIERGLRGGASEGGSSCRLVLELDEFVQTFESASVSSAGLVLRASWMPVRGGVPLARREFRLSRATPSADAEGGVIAYRELARQLNSMLADWLVALDRDGPQGLNTEGRCGP